MATYEYKSIILPNWYSNAKGNELRENKINRIAKEGWKYHSQFESRDHDLIITFEREVKPPKKR